MAKRKLRQSTTRNQDYLPKKNHVASTSRNMHGVTESRNPSSLIPYGL